MNGVEFFNPSEGGESYDPKAFERFKEIIRKNAAFVAALRKSEQKQKKKEDQLLKILMKFFQTHQKQGVVLLASRMLEQNIPASFVFAVIILGNYDLQKEVAGYIEKPVMPVMPETETPTEFSLITKFTDQTLPLKLKAEIDAWGKNIYETALSQVLRIFETVLDKESKIKKIVIDCMGRVLQDFLENAGLRDFSYDSSFSFCEFLIKLILNKVKKDLEARPRITETLV